MFPFTDRRLLRRGATAPLPSEEYLLTVVTCDAAVPWSTVVDAVADLLLGQLASSEWLVGPAFADAYVWWPAAIRAQASAIIHDAIARQILEIDAAQAQPNSRTRPTVSRPWRTVWQCVRSWCSIKHRTREQSLTRAELDVLDVLNQTGW